MVAVSSDKFKNRFASKVDIKKVYTLIGNYFMPKDYTVKFIQ